MRRLQSQLIYEPSRITTWCPASRRRLGLAESTSVWADDVELFGELIHLRPPHARIGDRGVEHQDRKAGALPEVMDLGAVDVCFHTRAVSSALNFSSVSSSSRAASESGITPTPAYRRAPSSQSRPQRSATANSPSPLASIQPTAPAYQPRSMASSSSMSESAAARGQPPTAGVGWRAAASSRASAAGSRRGGGNARGRGWGVGGSKTCRGGG